MWHFFSRASDIPSRASIVKVSSPNIAGSLPYVVAIGMISQVMNVSKRKQAIVPIHHLQVSKVCCFSEPFFCKMATPHLGGCVVTPWTSVHYFSSKLHHACMAPQVTEHVCWPIPYQHTWSKLQPPMSMLWILYTQTIG